MEIGKWQCISHSIFYLTGCTINNSNAYVRGQRNNLHSLCTRSARRDNSCEQEKQYHRNSGNSTANELVWWSGVSSWKQTFLEFRHDDITISIAFRIYYTVLDRTQMWCILRDICSLMTVSHNEKLQFLLCDNHVVIFYH